MNAPHIKKKNRSEKNFAISMEEWENLEAVSWRKFNWKNKVRYFISPARSKVR